MKLVGLTTMMGRTLAWTLALLLAGCAGDGDDDLSSGDGAADDGGSEDGSGDGNVDGSGDAGDASSVGGTSGGDAGTSAASTAADDAGDAPAPDCMGLRDAYDAAVIAARACDLAAPNTCELSETVEDWCGCQMAVNADSDQLDALQAAYDAWVGAGCGPLGCGSPCPVGEATCTPSSGGGGSCRIGG